MSMAAQHDLPFMGGMRRRKSQGTATIFVDDLLEEYTCPICFDEINKCKMTPCGHNFCEKCIAECLNRKHICPFCSKECTVEQLIRNVHLDSVLHKLVKARADASRHLITDLMQKSTEASKQSAPKITSDSPIARIFTQYASQTLIKYENYYQELMRENNINLLRLQSKLHSELASILRPIRVIQNKLKKQLQPGHADADGDGDNGDDGDNSEQKQMMDLEGPGPGAGAGAEDGDAEGVDNASVQKLQELFTNIVFVEGSDDHYFSSLQHAMATFVQFIQSKAQDLDIDEATLNETQSILSTFDAEMQLTQKRLQRSCKLLCDAYEQYMKSITPSPFLLPVAVSIRVRGRPQFWDLKLNATDRIGIVVEVVKQKFLGLADPIESWSGQIELGLLRPLADRDPNEPMETAKNLEQCMDELNIRQGTQIHVLTPFRLQSEKPRPCFTYGYDKDKGLKCDYYRCATCGFNWVCAPCSTQCHAGHDLVPFMMNHVPSYACCYCVKKKKCKILNSKSK